MILNDVDVRKLIDNKLITIDPYIDTFQGANCYYCHLGNKCYIPKKTGKVIDVENSKDIDNNYDFYENLSELVLNPGEFVLTETFEYLGVDKGHIIRFFNPTTIARWGIYHAGLGFVNAGCGNEKPIKPTLELINLGKDPVKLQCTTIQNNKVKFGTEILKIYLQKLTNEASFGYTGCYGLDVEVALPRTQSRRLNECYELASSSHHYSIGE